MNGCVLTFAVLVIAACNDGHALADGAVDAARVTEITIRGVVTRHDEPSTPVPSVLVAADQLDDDSLAGSVITGATGAFTIVLQTPAGFADVYLVATSTAASPALVDTYYNFASVLVTDTDAAIDAFTPAAYSALYSAADVSAAATDGTMQVRGRIFEGGPLVGATLRTFSGSGTVVYDSGSGAPDPSATSTSTDGIGYVMNASTDVVF